MTWPPTIPKCPDTLRVFFEQLIARQNAAWPIDGAGIRCADGAAGRSINAISEPGGSGGGTELVPLEPYDDSDDTDLRVSIKYGTVGGLDLDDYGPITITATRYFFAEMTADSDGFASSVSLVNQASSTPPASTDTVSYLYLGRAVVVSGAITTVDRNLSGSQTYQRCGYAAHYEHFFDLA